MKYKHPDLLGAINAMAKSKGTSLKAICQRMDRPHNFLHTHLRTNNPRIEVLLELSDLMNVNLLETYMALLKPTVRTTAVERDLIQQLAAKTAELETVKAERDRLWGVLEKRVG